MEKLISGMYLGEITRLILLSLIDANTYSPSGKKKALVFGGKGNEVMNTTWGVDTQYMSEVEDAWGEEDDKLPQFSSFDVNKLDEEKRARLERVRVVVVNRFGYQDAEVGAWDAAVCIQVVYSHRPKYLTYGSGYIGRTMGMQISRTSCGSFKQCSNRCSPDTDRPSSSWGWSRTKKHRRAVHPCRC
jgi:hypothetical protein